MSGRSSLSSTRTTSPASRPGRLPPVLVATSVVAAWTLLLVYLLVIRTEWGQHLDEYAFAGHDFFQSRAAQADSFLRLVSIGSLLLAIALVAAVAVVRRRPRLALLAAVSVITAIAITEILKLVILTRPALYPTFLPQNSFPSGHTTVGMSVAVATMLVVPRRVLIPTAIGAGLFGAAFGIAVVAAGWHRPSDALGAYLVVLSVAAACSALTFRYPDPPDVVSRQLPRRLRSVRIGATELGLTALALGGMGVFGLAALSYRGIPWTSTGAGFLLSAGALLVLALLTAVILAAVILQADRWEARRSPSAAGLDDRQLGAADRRSRHRR